MKNEDDYFEQFKDGSQYDFVLLQVDITGHTGWLRTDEQKKYQAKKELAERFIEVLKKYELHRLFWAGDGGVFVCKEEDVKNYDILVEAADAIYKLFEIWKEKYEDLDAKPLSIRTSLLVSSIITDVDPSFWTSFDLNKIIKYERWISDGAFAITEKVKDKLKTQKYRFENHTKEISTKYGKMKVFPDSIYRVGFGQQRINPTSTLPLVGFFPRTQPTTNEVLDNDLLVQTILFYDGKRYSAIISYDSLGLDHELVIEIKKKLREKADLEEKDILITANHTHSAPALMNYVPSEWIKNIDYVNSVIEKTLESFDDALCSCDSATLSLGSGECCLSRGRCNDHQNIADPRVNVLKIDTTIRTIILFIFACHPVILKEPKASPDFVGYARDVIQTSRISNKETFAIFLNGCAGNINPCDENKNDLAGNGQESAKKMGKKLGNIVNEIISNTIPLWGSLPIINGIRSFRTLEKSVNNKTSPHPVSIQVLSLASIKIIGISGEPFIETSRSLAKILGQNAFVIGYANENIGYIPPKEYYQGAEIAEHKYWTVNAGKEGYGITVPQDLEEQVTNNIKSLVDDLRIK